MCFPEHQLVSRNLLYACSPTQCAPRGDWNLHTRRGQGSRSHRCSAGITACQGRLCCGAAQRSAVSVAAAAKATPSAQRRALLAGLIRGEDAPRWRCRGSRPFGTRSRLAFGKAANRSCSQSCTHRAACPLHPIQHPPPSRNCHRCACRWRTDDCREDAWDPRVSRPWPPTPPVPG